MTSRTESPGHAGRRPAVSLHALAALLAVALAPLVTPSPAHAAVADTTSATSAVESGGVPQRDLLDVFGQIFRHDRVEPGLTTEARPGLSLSILPSVGYNPSYGGFLGVSVAVGGWLGDPETTTLSSGSAGASYSSSGQISVQLKSDFFTPGNAWALKGDWRYLDTSQPTYGLGPATYAQSYVLMDFVLYRFYQTAYWRVPETDFFIGLGYHFDCWDQISEPDVAADTVTDYQRYSGGPVSRSTASGVSFNVLYDTRDNPINARQGTYWNVNLRAHLRELGSDHDWQSMSSDLRVYPPLPKGSRNTLAIWNTAWFAFGEAPYLNLPAIGWDTYGRGGRGYLQGRIRGQNQIYTEGEYRLALTRDGLLGAVGFLNLTATTIPDAGHFGRLDPGYGVGLRMKYNKRTSINLAVDLAYDRFGASHYFFGMQEVF